MDLCGLARVLSGAMGVRFTESDIRRALGAHRVRGSNNFVVCVFPSSPSSMLEYGIADRSPADRSPADRSPAKRHAVALRVARGETDDDEVEAERVFGQHAFERGFGLEPLFSGNLQTPTRGLRSASCWPWGTCLYTLRVNEEVETDCPYGTVGTEIARALRRASETLLALDACAVRNHVRARGEWRLIDFDPYFTKVAETEAQRAAARGFVAVQMLLLGSQMPGLFTLDDIAKETERSEAAEAERSEEDRRKRSEAERREEDRRKQSEEGDGPRVKRHRRCSVSSNDTSDTYELSSSSVGTEDPMGPAASEAPMAPMAGETREDPAAPEAPMAGEAREAREAPMSREDLARELVARVVRVATSFPDAARALACVVQMYGAYGMVGVARKPARRAMADANKPDSVDVLVGAGAGETHASLFVRAALGLVGPDEFEEQYAARIAGFFKETKGPV